LLGIGPYDNDTIYRAKGCGRCAGSGYEGRLGVYELVLIDETLRRLIHDDASEHELADHAFKKGDSLARCGFRHVLAGVTSIEEVLRVVRQEDDDADISI
jgi:general secretion pathway protein E